MSTVECLDKNKWESQYISKHFKNQKNLSTWRHNNYRYRLKKQIRRKTRYDIRSDAEEDDYFCEPIILISYYHKYYVNQRKYYKRQQTKKQYSDIICNENYEFNHNFDINNLLSLKPDKYLRSKILITYWNKRELQFEGELTCISHLGFIKLQNIEYIGDAYTGYIHFGLPNKLGNAYWFHYKCIAKIVMYNNNNKMYDINITQRIMDLLKLKVIQWLKTQKPNIINQIINNINKQDVELKHIVDLQCMGDINKIFLKEQKNINPFMLFLRKYKKLQQEKLKFNKCELANIIYQYAKISKLYKTMSISYKNQKVSQRGNRNYLDWDSNQIERLTQRKSNRTV